MAKKFEYKLPKHEVLYGVEVPIGDLKIDDKAQRTLNKKRAEQLADTFVPEAVGTIIVSERESGGKYIIDGQHRWYASKLKGLESVVCEVHKGLTQVDEATLFLIKNRESSRPSALDEYHIGLTGNIPLFVETDKAIRSRGLTMGSSSANTIGAVSGVLRITDKYGPEILERTLAIAEGAWGRNPETWDGMLPGGISEVIGRHSDKITSDEDLAHRIGSRMPAFRWKGEVQSQSSGGGARHSGTGGRIMTCYHMIIEVWNRGRRSPATRIEV